MGIYNTYFVNAINVIKKIAAKSGKELFKFTGTAAKHMDDASRMIPTQTLDDIIKAHMSV